VHHLRATSIASGPGVPGAAWSSRLTDGALPKRARDSEQASKRRASRAGQLVRGNVPHSRETPRSA
jgi:hypothetical protein